MGTADGRRGGAGIGDVAGRDAAVATTVAGRDAAPGAGGTAGVRHAHCAPAAPGGTTGNPPAPEAV
jgi:hypothetical protein